MRYIHKIICGSLVTLGLILLPLPTMADTPVETAPETTNNVTETPPTPAPAVSDTPASTNTTTTTTVTDQPLAPTLELQAAVATTSIDLNNTIDSAANSGNATVSDNETAGGATTGDATATATVLNIANANGSTTPEFNTFTCDITGDSSGDIVIDPASLLPICNTTAIDTSTQTTTSTQGLQTGASLVDILNNIILSAQSGNATVSENEIAGNATTGNATSLANIVNIANTTITSKKAFLGIINIFGNLTGDILVPQSLVDGLTDYSGAGQNSGIDTTSIANTISADAQSGNATVSDNETAGSATTGDATTNITVFNLTGQQVVAKNSLLVFVNILGKWTGIIVPAPGSTTATLGSGIQGNTAEVNTSGSDDTVSITNNVLLASQTGNATISNNETAGNATTGNAKAGANILNITNSNFLLDDWFGALFINVLGSWLGNFDIQAAIAQQETENPSSQPVVVQDVQVYQFTSPTTVTAASNSSRSTSVAPVETSAPTPPTDTGHVFSASTVTPQSNDNSHSSSTDFLTLAGLTLALTIIIAATTIGVRRKFLA